MTRHAYGMGRGFRRITLGLLVWWCVAAVVRFVGRFAFGLPLVSGRRTDATFFCRGTKYVNQLPDWFGRREPSRWSLLPGYKRAGARWGVLLTVWAIAMWPRVVLLVVLNVAGVAAVVAAVRVVRGLRMRRHNRDVVRPLWATLSGYLGVAPTDDHSRYLDVPHDYATNRAAVATVTYPAGWDAHSGMQDRIEALMARHIGASWDVAWGALGATWSHAPAPPQMVPWADLEPEQYRVDEIPLGVAARGRTVVVSMRLESPHWMVAAPSGGGKSSTLRIPAVHTRGKGGLVDIIDFKLTSYTASLERVSGIRVHTDMESAVWALSEFYVSMLGANQAIKAGLLRPEDIPPRLLIIDEFGTLMSLVNGWWRRQGLKGKPPFLDAWRIVLYQGRSSEHRMIVGVHTPAASLFGSTDERNAFVTRLLAGKASDTKWRQTFDSEPRIPYDERHPGRYVINTGELEELQVAWLDEAEARSRAEAAESAPDWFDRGALPPWVTEATLERAAKEVGIDWLSLDGTAPAEGSVMAAPEAVDVPVHVTRVVPAEAPPAALPAAEPVAALPAPAKAESDAESEPPEAPAEPAEVLIVGIPAAADYLTEQGYATSTVALTQARKRAMKAGTWITEQRAENGWPSWRPEELLDWQRRRVIAGRRRHHVPPGGARSAHQRNRT